MDVNEFSLRQSRPKPHGVIAATALSRTRQEGRRGSHLYSNENYAILGAMIERLSGQPYQEYCSSALFKPLGIQTAGLSQKFGGLGAFGGWEVSGEDYLRFFLANFGPQSPIGSSPLKWPQTAAVGDHNYGMGVRFKRSGDGYDFWHAGRFGTKGQHKHGALVVSWGGEWAIFVSFNRKSKSHRINQLRSSLRAAALE